MMGLYKLYLVDPTLLDEQHDALRYDTRHFPDGCSFAGAIDMVFYSTLTIEGESTFSNNRAGFDGGE